MSNYAAATHLGEVAGWQMKPSERTYLEVKQNLRSYVKSMQAAITYENEAYTSAFNAENKRYEAKLDEIKTTYLVLPNKQATELYDTTIRKANEAYQQACATADKKVANYRITYKSSNLFFKLFGSIIRRRDSGELVAISAGADYIEKNKRSAAAALSQVREAAGKLRDAKIQLNNRRYEEARNQATEEHRLKQENIESRHRNELATIVNNYEREFLEYFNSGTFNTAYDMVNTIMRSAQGYSCSDKVPQVMFLGYRTFAITNGSERFAPEVLMMFSHAEHKAIKIDNSRIEVCLPFFRTLEEGYSVYLEVPDAAEGNSNRIVWEYVMKVLMNFPVGQTRPLLLDVDSTTELTDFKVIGDSSGRNLVTKPWTSAEDIEAELKKLATDQNNLTISYGKDVAARMLREPIHVVACRNFPKGLKQEALDSMATIFRAGSKSGFFGILQAVEKEMYGADVSTVADIKRACLHIRESNSGYAIGDDTFVFERMDAAHQNKQDIFSHLITGVARYRRQIEKFEYLFSKDAGNIEKMDMHDINTWFRGDSSYGFEVPIGISGASTVQKYSIGGVAQHGLISGVTGSGKSTLLKTMIVAAMMKYTPDNLNLYLVDFKEGVEFATFSEYRLPWIKTIALNTQRIFALNILQELQKEFKERANIMRQTSAHHINEANEKFPRLMLVFDEVQALLGVDDDITRKCVNILSELVSEGRAMNINVIMASQNFSICKGIDVLKANMVLRIAMKGSPESAKIVMGDDFSVAQLEQGDSGSAAINTASGARGQTTFFQVGYMSDSEMKDLLGKLQMTWGHLPAKTRVMAIHVNQDREAKFNRLITDGEVNYGSDSDNYELMLGDEFALHRKRQIFIGRESGENLMVIGEKEDVAKSIFALSMLSALYGELANRAEIVDNELVRLIDMSDDYLPDAEYLDKIAERFDRQINRVTGKKARDMIEDTYQHMQDRKRGRASKEERLFLMIFGLDSLNDLKQELFSEDEGELSLNKKLLQILQQGPELGINCILWARSYDGFRSVIDTVNANRYFNKRIYFGDNEDAATVLGIKFNMNDLTEKSVAYRDMDKATPNAFRVFELPSDGWLESLAEAYKQFGHKQ